MVYCGKPSKGCSSCRERKIRCDQNEPACGQCEKRQQECPGYRNLVDLMFRDESSQVIRKAAKTRARGRTQNYKPSVAGPGVADAGDATTPSSAAQPESSDPASWLTSRPAVGRQHRIRARGKGGGSANGSLPAARLPTPFHGAIRRSEHNDDSEEDLLPFSEEGQWPAPASTTILYALSPSFQERGTAYFFSRYVSVDENACHQNYDFIFQVWRPASLLPNRQTDGVMASMTAVGLAGLSNLTQHPAMMDWARRSYGTALALTNQALRDPSEAVKDTTMLSILVLGTYEMLTGKNAQTVRAWQEHINGAAALASMRGLGQFGTKAGARMFMMLTQIVLISCIQRNMPMPPPLVELRNQLGMLTGGRDPNWRLTGPIYRVMQLRHDIKCGNLRGTQNVIRELLMVDQEFVDIVADLPDFWHHRLVTLSNPHPAVFDGYHCHVFPSLGLAATWNGVRSLRMLVHETVMGEIFKSLGQQDILCWPEDAKVQLTQSLALLHQLRDAILASVPQHFGVVSFKDGPPESRGQSADTHTGKRPLARFGLSASSSSTSTSASPDASPNRPPPKVASFTGPTLHDPAEAEGISDGAERFMTLASASNTIVWPLYLLGVSSSCTKDVREYVTERLEAIHEETSLVQARIVAHMVRSKRLSIPWSDLPWDQMPQLQNTADPVLV